MEVSQELLPKGSWFTLVSAISQEGFWELLLWSVVKRVIGRNGV